MRIKTTNYKPNETFKILRQAIGLTQIELAKQLDISRSAIQKYEYGTVDFPYELVHRIAKKNNLVIVIESK